MFFAFLFVATSLSPVSGTQYPIPYQFLPKRPPSNPYCDRALFPFCPTGDPTGKTVVAADNDTFDIYSLQAPVWEFITGDLLANFKIFHDAIGFRSRATGLNYTLEWYELFELFNCTFPHVVPGTPYPVWCNEGATCFYDGIDDRHWSENGSLVLIGNISGSDFNKFIEWLHRDNDTAVYYITFRVAQDPSLSTIYIEPWDCSSFVLRAFDHLASCGAVFNGSVAVNHTRLTLFSRPPIPLGNASEIFGPQGNQTLAKSVMAFYSYFQPHQSIGNYFKHLVDVLEYVLVQDKFYYWYNDEYWLLHLHEPYFGLSFDFVPFPEH